MVDIGFEDNSGIYGRGVGAIMLLSKIGVAGMGSINAGQEGFFQSDQEGFFAVHPGRQRDSPEHAAQ